LQLRIKIAPTKGTSPYSERRNIRSTIPDEFFWNARKSRELTRGTPEILKLLETSVKLLQKVRDIIRATRTEALKQFSDSVLCAFAYKC